MFAVTHMLGISCCCVSFPCRSRIQLLPNVAGPSQAQQQLQASKGDARLGVGSILYLTWTMCAATHLLMYAACCLACRCRIQLLPNVARAVPAGRAPHHACNNLTAPAPFPGARNTLYLTQMPAYGTLSHSCLAICHLACALRCRCCIQLLPNVAGPVPAQQQQQANESDARPGVWHAGGA
jgi:hypothetical protein